MRTLTLITTFALSSLSAQAQEVTLSDYTKVNNRYDLFIIGGDEQGVFTGLGDDYYYQGFNSKQVVSYYDFQQGQLASKVMKPAVKSREYFYSFYFQKQLHLLQYDDRSFDEDGQYQVYLSSYDTSLNPTGEERKISQLYPYLFTFDVGSLFRSYFSNQHGKMRRSAFYHHKVSADERKVALFFNYNFFGQANTEFQALVLDESMETAWSAQIDLPDADGSHRMLEDYALANDGTLYVLVANYDNDNFKKTAVGYEYQLFAYRPDEETVQEVPFTTDSKFVINLGLQLDQQQQPVLAGVYADPTTNDILGGVRIQGDQCTSFTFASAEFEEINTKKDKHQAEEYAVKNIVWEDDGSVVFFAESYKRGPIIKPKLGLGGLSPIDADVEIGDIYRKILAVKIGTRDNHWIKIVDKTQRSSEARDVFTSFAFTHDAQGYYLLFNDRIKNTSDVSLVTVTPGGAISIETLLDRSSYRLRAVSAFATSVKPGLLALPVEKNRKQAVATVRF